MADWSRLTQCLRASGEPRLELSFAAIEKIIGAELPRSSRYAAFWSNSSAYAKAWKRANYATTRRGVLAGHIAFVRTATPVRAESAISPPSRHGVAAPDRPSAHAAGVAVRDVSVPDTTPDVLLVGCVKTKRSQPSRAADMYISGMFQRRRQYAEEIGVPWYIISAEHGLLDPASLIEPYDVYLADESEEYRRAWGAWVAAKLERRLGSLQGRVVEVHAGAAYVNAVDAPLRGRGALVTAPLTGLRQGEQLSWYDRLAENRMAGDPVSEGTARRPTSGRVTDETGVMGDDLVIVDGPAAAEGVAPDDYDTSRCLISPLKDSDGKLLRPGRDVPAAYAEFPLVSHVDQIVAPDSRDALAVRLHEDDITSWVGYALARLAVRRARPDTVSSVSSRTTTPASPERPGPTASTAGVVQALLDFGRSQSPQTVAESSFTPHPEANALIINDPFAFLLAVIFDQGIPAERAWRAPYELARRLGHLDPERLFADEAAVRAAVAQPPALHRYREKVPGWLVAAAGIVLSDYGGDAAGIWSDEPAARELQRRFERFPGVGQKKAAMAVEILERDLRVPIRDLHGSDIAYDVHVRRVLLRTGLAQYDDLAHMVEVARRAYPERPGAIDYPAWLVGRQWCHAGLPDCSACVLRNVCARDIGRANAVRGA